TRAGFGKALAPDRLALQDLRQVEGLLLVGRVDDQGRTAMVDADEIGADPRRVRLRIFLEPDDLLDDRKAAPAIVRRPVDPRPAGIEQPALPGLVEIERLVGVERPLLRRHVGVKPFAAFLAEALLLG